MTRIWAITDWRSVVPPKLAAVNAREELSPSINNKREEEARIWKDG